MTNELLNKFRELSGQQIGLLKGGHQPIPRVDDVVLDPSVLKVLEKVQLALLDGYSGAILVGPPGTGKSRAALQIANEIVGGASERCAIVQFHPSYQYEDFMEGYVPDGKGGFELRPKTLLQLCDMARNDLSRPHVMLIDEISRSDVTRVFGEALTYLEPEKRRREFRLQSGTKTSIPPNVVVLATMNPWDRGMDELDWAIERRFAKIEMAPDIDVLIDYCRKRSFPPRVEDGLVKFFHFLQGRPNPQCKIGHAYFMNSITYDPDALQRLWEFQLSHHFRKALGSDVDEYERIRVVWQQNIVQAISEPPPPADSGTVA